MYKVKDGWEPLCQFLEVEVPDQPFPHLNIGGEVVANDLQNQPYFKRCQLEMKCSLLFISCLLGYVIYQLSGLFW